MLDASMVTHCQIVSRGCNSRFSDCTTWNHCTICWSPTPGFCAEATGLRGECGLSHASWQAHAAGRRTYPELELHVTFQCILLSAMLVVQIHLPPEVWILSKMSLQHPKTLSSQMVTKKSNWERCYVQCQA